MKLDTSSNRNGSLEKANRIMLAFSDDEPELGLMELSRRVGISKSTASRFVYTLLQIGLLERVDGGRRFRLSLKVFELGMVALRRCASLSDVRPALLRLTQELEETATYGVLIDGQLVFVERADPIGGAADIEIGRRYPAMSSAAGRVLLADRVAVRSPVESISFLSMGPPLEISPRQRAELGAIGEVGWARDRGEWQPGVASVAAAVLDRTGHTVGALTLVGAAARMARAGSPAVLGMLIRTANEISRRFGCHRVRLPSLAPLFLAKQALQIELQSA